MTEWPVADPAELRAAIVASARGWIDTPYVHRQSAKGAGCDCLGLLRGVWREVVGPEPETPPLYRPGWAESGGRESLLEAARRHLVEIDRGAWRDGDVLLFRWAPKFPAKHAAIVSVPESDILGAPGWIVHAYEGGRAVQEVAIPRGWKSKIAAAFAFPGVV